MHRYCDDRIVGWLQENGYHPRSDKHGRATCDFFLDDLLHVSKPLRIAASKGHIVYSIDYKVGDIRAWAVDLVVGPPKTKVLPVESGSMARGEPKEIWLAVDAKAIMTEHGKARRNRQRDINSFWEIVKAPYPDCVTSGIILVNAATRFRSPLRPEGQITQHRNIERLVEETIQLFKEIPKAGVEGGRGIEGVGIIVVDHTNISGEPTRLVKGRPAPIADHETHYRTFLEQIRTSLESRHLA